MRRATAILLLILLPLVSGCWDRTEVEDTAYVVALGIDSAGKNDFLWTFAVARSQSPAEASQGGTQPGGMLMYTVRATNLEQALQLVQISVGRVLSMHQLRFFILGQDLCEQGLSMLVSQMMRHNEVRRGGAVSMIRGRAVEAMEAFRPMLDTNPIKVQEGLLIVQRRRHLTPPVLFQHFYAQLLSTGQDPFLSVEAINPQAAKPNSSPLPMMDHRSIRAGEAPRHGGNPVEFAGTAIFHNAKLVGTLTVDETAALLALRGEMGKVYQTLPDPDRPDQMVSIRFGQENKPRVRARFQGGRPVIRVHLQLEGELLSAPSGTKYDEPANRRRLEDYIDAKQAEQYSAMIRKVYQEWGADPAGFGQAVRARFPTMDDWLGYNWLDHVREADIQVTTQTFIRRFGLLLNGGAPSEDDPGQ